MLSFAALSGGLFLFLIKYVEPVGSVPLAIICLKHFARCGPTEAYEGRETIDRVKAVAEPGLRKRITRVPTPEDAIEPLAAVNRARCESLSDSLLFEFPVMKDLVTGHFGADTGSRDYGVSVIGFRLTDDLCALIQIALAVLA